MDWFSTIKSSVILLIDHCAGDIGHFEFMRSGSLWFDGLCVSVQGAFTVCAKMKASTVKYSFFCDRSCNEADIGFWYRMTTFTPQCKLG